MRSEREIYGNNGSRKMENTVTIREENFSMYHIYIEGHLVKVLMGICV